ncbi:MAG: magnesium-protoporphyrin IX monomethyl ester anaerobic oxidative cyclase [Nitratireductor sp.]
MRILLIHPPHTAIGSRIPKENLPPLGLLAIGGPLIDAGHRLELLNADTGPMTTREICRRAICARPDAILIGHSGSTSAHPVSTEIAMRLREELPDATIIYGGVYPSYHWQDILEKCPAFDVIVRGEGEQTALDLIEALQAGTPLSAINGIAFRKDGKPFATAPAAMISDLDAYRIGWELIDHKDYSYWGGLRGVVMQFSRGCPHLCTYCGQRGFWTKWRHRDPVKFAAEIARLVREEGIELINLADENPTSSRRLWKQFLEAMIAENVKVTIIGSTRAGDIVRDADILHLYKKAGILRFLLGMENTDDATLAAIRKGSDSTIDKEAIRLLRAHGMIGLCTWVVGFEEETDADYMRVMRQLLAYDPDQIMSVFATPHRWTPFYNSSAHRKVIQTDQRLWDYKHQVMATRSVPPWRTFLWVKLIEFALQTRPKALYRTFLHPDPEIRHAMRWYTRMGRRVFFHELFGFLFRERRLANGPTVAQYWNGKQQLPEEALSRKAVKITLQRDMEATGMLSQDQPVKVPVQAAN